MTTLAVATLALDQLCNEIDDAGELPPDLLERFAEAKLSHQEKVGAYVHVINTARHNAAYYSERAELLKRRAKTCERIEAAVKDRLMYQVKEFPDLPWKSLDGDKIALRNNAEKLEVDLALDHRHVNNVICDHSVVPLEFITVNTFYTLNKEMVRAHLATGHTLSWARMSRGQHLRIY